jgi:hypothetical protein
LAQYHVLKPEHRAELIRVIKEAVVEKKKEIKAVCTQPVLVVAVSRY